MKACVNIIGKKVSMSKIKVSLVKLLLHEAYNESMCQYYKRESFIVKPKGRSLWTRLLPWRGMNHAEFFLISMPSLMHAKEP